MEMEFTNINPIGKVLENEYIEKFTASMKALWDQTKQKNAWWKVWKRMSLAPVTKFLLHCLDDLISYVDQVVDESGPDKKATVLAAIAIIYDYISREALPLWAKPFSNSVRQIVIYIIMSAAIDWIIEKYRHGSWRPKPLEEVQAQWIELHAQLFGVPGGHRPS